MYSDLINSRFAYVSVLRASHDEQIAASLVSGLSHDSTKTSAIEMEKAGYFARHWANCWLTRWSRHWSGTFRERRTWISMNESHIQAEI